MSNTTPLGFISYMDYDFATFGNIGTDEDGGLEVISFNSTCRGEYGRLVASERNLNIVYTVIPEKSPITQLQLTIDLLESTKRGLINISSKIKIVTELNKQQ